MIEVRCAQCGVVIFVPPAVRGRAGVCFGCGAPLKVPAEGQSAESRSIAFRSGDRVSDRYEIHELLGKGGMGVVYRSFDTLINEEVALKFMKPELLRTRKGQQLFVQEAQVARRLRHENVVAVHDVGTSHEGFLYISMEFLKGFSVRHLLKQRRQMRKLVNVRFAINIVAQTLAALDYAHRTVIHRDIKPENIMIMSGERVKVLDFGLARAIHIEDEMAEAEQKSKRVIGTLAYASPEQVKHQAIDHRADLFAVGLVFRELLTLRTPMDEPVEIPRVRNDVSPSVLAVLSKALEPEKDKRWQTAGEFRAALAEAFEQSYRPVQLPHADGASGAAASTEGMVFLDGGSFLMGNNGFPDEAPEFEAFVEPFYMDATPVTVAQYAAYMESASAPKPKFWDHNDYSGDTQPVVGVSWAEANAYAAWAGKLLPTEKQWEFAARGRENRKYPWGNIEPDATHSNYRDHLGMPSNVHMHEDGMTPDGIKDLAGNVDEWTRDPFVSYGTDEAAAANVPLRAVRGGSWHSTPNELRCTFRQGLFPETQAETLGFRCVVPARPEWKADEAES
ncbi:MAG: Non-specific serine/threonine protein kinase [Candidatus Hydrogenedentes bacterium]|nr:Non-specific serine/threonine protein kinase [Candidatus Hydrogenedentota bacterium]